MGVWTKVIDFGEKIINGAKNMDIPQVLKYVGIGALGVAGVGLTILSSVEDDYTVSESNEHDILELDNASDVVPLIETVLDNPTVEI